MAMHITVKAGGIANIQFFLTARFIGTSGEGNFPPVGVRYEEFGFVPTPNQDGVLAFSHLIGDGLMLVQYRWKDQKLEVKEGMRGLPRTFSHSQELGLVTQRESGGYYITGSVSPNMEPNQFQKVGMVQKLKQHEGKNNLE